MGHVFNVPTTQRHVGNVPHRMCARREERAEQDSDERLLPLSGLAIWLRGARMRRGTIVSRRSLAGSGNPLRQGVSAVFWATVGATQQVTPDLEVIDR